MRKLFSRQLIEARHEMLSIYEAVDLALHDAVKAYVTATASSPPRPRSARFRLMLAAPTWRPCATT